MTNVDLIDEEFMRNGRHVEHDPRSWAYRLDDIVRPVKLGNVNWPNFSGVLNQGKLGACVGFASVALCGTAGNHGPLDEGRKIAVKANPTGIAFYSRATALDQVPGSYPPNDTGSTGLGGAKAAKELGYIHGYTHAFSYEAMVKALMLGPLMIGTNWYSSMRTPDSNGLVTIASGASLTGGHEYMVYGYSVDRGVFFCQNSWGTSWGLGGKFSMNYKTMERLLGEQGDATQFVPLNKPAPVPQPPAPTPGATPEDVAFWTSVKVWARSKGLT